MTPDLSHPYGRRTGAGGDGDEETGEETLETGEDSLEVGTWNFNVSLAPCIENSNYLL